MKLARTNLFVICTNDLDRAGRNYRQSRRPNATRTFDVRRPSGQLAARWHVCPQTHRLECCWSLEAAAPDDQLCRYTMLRRRRQTSRRVLIRPSGHNPTPAVTNSDLVTFKWCGPARTHTQWDLTQLGRKMPCHE
jgi:hypothetical protein